MSKIKLSLLISILAIALVFSAANFELKAAVELPKIKVKEVVVMGNFISSGNDNPTVVNLLYEEEYKQSKIQKGFNPDKTNAKDYFRKGLAEAFKRWGLNIENFKFQHIAYKESITTGAYRGYLVLLEDGSDKEIKMKWEKPE